MSNSGWIDIQVIRPTEQDGDACGRVMVWHVLNGAMLVGWFKTGENRFITHWRRIPEGPDGYRQMRWDALNGTDRRFL